MMRRTYYFPAMTSLKLSFPAEGIALVTLTHPPMNAMDADLLEELAALFEGLAADRTVRAAVIAADGPAFSAGLNLKTVPSLDRLGQRRLVDALNEAFGTLYGWPKPLVAAVNGHAIAGGLILALCADWRVAADVPMQVSLAEVRVGVTYPVAAARSRPQRTVARRGAATDAARRDARCGGRRGPRRVRRARASRQTCASTPLPRPSATPHCRPRPLPRSSARSGRRSLPVSPPPAPAMPSRASRPGSARRCGGPRRRCLRGAA